MWQIRIHGRGGQGVVTAAELLSVAAFRQGLHAQAFPSFGSERTGAPVVAFCRLADAPIRTHDPISSPDAVIVQDVTLLAGVDVLSGLAPAGYVLLNTSHAPADLGLGDVVAALPPGHVRTVPATDLALAHVGRALPNVPLLGAFAALTGWVTIDAVAAAIAERFAGPVAQRNIAAAEAAHALVATPVPTEVDHAPAG